MIFETQSLLSIRLAILLMWAVGAPCVSSLAQEPAASISFEVVSVKPSAPGCVTVMIGPSDDGFHMQCLNMLQLVQYAYGMNLSKSDDVQGMPKWASSEHFDLDAPIQGVDRARFNALTPPEKARLLRPALAERFALRVHEEQRAMPVYALVPGKSPAKLKPTDPQNAQKPILMYRGRSRILGYHCTMADFVDFITPLRGRTVVDRTGMIGSYDFSIEFASESERSPALQDPAGVGDVLPSIFTAVEEQMGLRLIPDNAPQPVIVVDAVSHPTAN